MAKLMNSLMLIWNTRRYNANVMPPVYVMLGALFLACLLSLWYHGTMILLDHITKTYPGDEEPALDNVSLHIEPHEFVFLVGKSGAGKSTLIKMITKEEHPDSGKIIIGGIDLDYVKKRHIPHYRRRLGVVFQDYKLLPTRTVFENVAFALEIAGMSSREISRTVPKVLDLVGLADKAHKFPTHLSGGEQQRVSIARSVARQPKILIADEPTGNVDPLTRQEIIDLLQKINDFGTTLLVTTHDESIVNNLGKRVITLKDGRIINDQKNHGVYRLDDTPIIEDSGPIIIGSTMPAAQPTATTPKVRPIKVPGRSSRLNRLPKEEELKITHNERKNKSSATRNVAPTALKPTATCPVNNTAPVSASLKQFAQDSANQWYAASRPLKSAPSLADLGLGRTVKLKPAPSNTKRVSKHPMSNKIKTKRVI